MWPGGGVREYRGQRRLELGGGPNYMVTGKLSSLLGKAFQVWQVGRGVPTPLKVSPHLSSVNKPKKFIDYPE